MATSVITRNDSLNDNDHPKEYRTSTPSSSSYQLQIQHQPPNFVFLGEPFTIDFLVVEEDRKYSEKLNNTSSFSQDDECNSSSHQSQHRNQIDSSIDSSATFLPPSFDIVIELLTETTQASFVHPTKNVENIGTTSIPITDERGFAVVESDLLPIMTNKVDPQRRPEEQNKLALNVLQDPSPIALGEFGTIQCSLIIGGNSLDGGNKDDMLLSLHRQKMSAKTSTNSANDWDTNPTTITYQIRIIAFLCGTDRHRKRKNMHSSTTKSINIPNAACTALTSFISIVRHKILITSCSNDSRSHGNSGNSNSERLASNEWNTVWYKDEGGRDKCMEIVVGVYDRHHKALLEAIPMLLTLCYASSSNYNHHSLQQNLLSPLLPIPVTNQEILNVLSPKPNQRLVLDRDTGTMKIRFRVEDVSKNHQGQDFCLLIAVAALDNNNNNYHMLQNYRPDMIAPAVSFAVNVRSKRNKRPRQLTTASNSISVPASDAPSEQHVYPHGSIVPSMGSVLSTNTSTGVIAENYPRLTTMQLQDALRSVVQWIQDVVARTTYEIQKQEPCSSVSNQYLSSMSESMTTYRGEIQEHLNLLQYIIDFNASSPASQVLTDPNVNQTMQRAHEMMHQRQLTTFDSFRQYDSTNVPYSQGYYYESAIPTGGSTANGFHQHNPYQYQNQIYHTLPRMYHPAIISNYQSQTLAASQNRHGPHTQHQSMKQRGIGDYPINDSTSNSLTATKRQSQLREPKINFRSTQNEEDTTKTKNNDSYQVSIVKPVEFQKEYPINATAYSTYSLMESSETQDGVHHDETRESEVEYVFAKQFKSLRSGLRLGYPAYTIRKELIGFYQSVKTQPSSDTAIALQQQQQQQQEDSPSDQYFSRSHVFVPLQKDDFGMSQLEHAKIVFDQADPMAIQSMAQCGSIEAMLHRALVYEWSQGLSNV